MNTLYFECNMGAAGDMLMSSLYELCEDKETFLNTMNNAFAPFDVSLHPEPAQKCNVAGTHMHVMVHGMEEGHHHEHSHHDDHTHEDHVHEDHIHEDHIHEDHGHGGHTHEGHHHASYPSVLEQISALPLPEQVKQDSKAIYEIIGNAEASVHATSLDQIHFHEVGTLDAIADVVGCCYLIYLLSPDEILASPIHVGNGFVHCAHGILPVPAPATAQILKGIPFYTGSIQSELCTPTGAAILSYFVTDFTTMPPLAADHIGYGMGSKDFDTANCVRAFFGERFDVPTDYKRQSADDHFAGDDSVLSISCNLDDMTGEAIGLATEIMMAAGALDVYTIPVQMKKNRPGILFTCICRPEERTKFSDLFFLHTTTRGIRYQLFQRAKLCSTVETRHTRYGDIHIKKSSGYGIEKEKPEFDDLKSIVLNHHYSVSLEDIRRQADDNGSYPNHSHS